MRTLTEKQVKALESRGKKLVTSAGRRYVFKEAVKPIVVSEPSPAPEIIFQPEIVVKTESPTEIKHILQLIDAASKNTADISEALRKLGEPRPKIKLLCTVNRTPENLIQSMEVIER